MRQVVVAVLLLGASHAWAQDDATRQAARDLAQEGIALLKEGKYAEAQERLHRAYQLFPAPTVALYEGQALEKLGRYVEAAERYRAASLTEVPPDANSALRRAVERGAEEVARITPLIPRLTVELQGADPGLPGLEVRVDGQPLPPAMLGAKRPINPGEHEVAVFLHGKRQQSQKVRMVPGQSERIVLKVTAKGTAAPAAATEPEAAEAEPAAAAPSATPGPAKPRPASIERTLGYVSLGVGAVGLITGVSAGLVMVGKDSTLESHCPEGQCPPEYQDDLDAFSTWRTVSFIGYGVGIAGLGAGVALLLLAPREPQAEARARIVPMIGPGEVGVAGRF